MFEPIPIDEFRRRTGLDALEPGIRSVVSLRDIHFVANISVMSVDYLQALLRNVPLTNQQGIRPYASVRPRSARIDPHLLRVPQTFVERKKCQAFLESFPSVFDGFLVTKGVAKCTALIVGGVTKEAEAAMAFYVPPIIECGKSEYRLVDGMHRNFLVMRVGTTLESIMLEEVNTEFPCVPCSWNNVELVDEKPPKERRFFGLKPELFRDLKWVGIDG